MMIILHFRIILGPPYKIAPYGSSLSIVQIWLNIADCVVTLSSQTIKRAKRR
jgi:hypothetical protein